MKHFYFLPLAIISIISLTACSGPGMQLKNDHSQEVRLANLQFIPITTDVILQVRDEESRTQNAGVARLNGLFKYVPVEYKVGVGDELNIALWHNNGLNNPAGSTNGSSPRFIVNKNGSIIYPYVGKIYVAGKTIPQIQELITAQLEKLINNKPQLSVDVKVYNSQSVSVTGEVKAPNTIPLTNIPLTIIDAVGKAGGPNTNGDLTYVVLNRQKKNYILDLKNNANAQRIYLENKDIVMVPNTMDNIVYVLGEVVKPGAVPAQRAMNLTQALSEVEGINQATANGQQVFVLRNTANGPTAYQLDAENAGALLLAKEFTLHSGDIVYVGTYQPAVIYRIFSQFVPLANIAWGASAIAWNSTGTAVNVKALRH